VLESRLEPGPLGPFVEGYRAWLLERGYAPGSVEQELRYLGMLGRWMVAEDLAVGQLNGEGQPHPRSRERHDHTRRLHPSLRRCPPWP
jgi:hypothetical protein